MPQVPVKIRKERAAKLRNLGQKLYADLLQNMIGKTVSVLTEGNGTGLTNNYIRVKLKNKYAEGKIISVQIQGVQDDALVG